MAVNTDLLIQNLNQEPAPKTGDNVRKPVHYSEQFVKSQQDYKLEPLQGQENKIKCEINIELNETK